MKRVRRASSTRVRLPLLGDTQAHVVWQLTGTCAWRAAKAYLQRVRAMEQADRSGSDDEAGGDRHAELSERLRSDALEVR